MSGEGGNTMAMSLKQQGQLLRYNSAPLKSTQPCGCDEGAGWMCANHREKLFAESFPALTPIVGCAQPGPYSDKSSHVVTGLKVVGIGGAPTRPTTLPDDPKERKKYPISSGVLDYFPDAIVAIARVSFEGNEQHNPGLPLHWDRSKSADEADTMQRHFAQRGTRDKDGTRHTAKAAWRMLAYLQKEIEAERTPTPPAKVEWCDNAFSYEGDGVYNECQREKNHTGRCDSHRAQERREERNAKLA